MARLGNRLHHKLLAIKSLRQNDKKPDVAQIVTYASTEIPMGPEFYASR
jgi:hypothetical protein